MLGTTALAAVAICRKSLSRPLWRARFAYDILTVLSLRAAYTAAIYFQLLSTAEFCRNRDKRGNGR